MKITDITRELFGAPVYPDDPRPELEAVQRIEDGAACNLSVLHACLHNGTHLDAPRHFFADGADVTQVPPEATVGECSVVRWDGVLTGADAERLQPSLRERVLFKGSVELTESAAFVLSDCQVRLIGVEGQSVGNAAVHRQLLGGNVFLLEGVDLHAVSEGIYFLFAAPLKLADADGAPVRALLLEKEKKF